MGFNHWAILKLNMNYIIIRVHSAFSVVASSLLSKYTRTDDVNCLLDLI